MRVALVLATALAGSVVGVAGATTASAAETCTPPRVAGYVVNSLSAEGIGCHEAQTHAAHTIRHGAPAGWTCHHRIHGRAVSQSCHKDDEPAKKYHFSYHVN